MSHRVRIAACLHALFEQKPVTSYVVLAAAIGVQEMVLALWLIARGLGLLPFSHGRPSSFGRTMRAHPGRTPMTNADITASQRQAARIAGLAFVFGILYVPVYLSTSAGLTVAGDPAATFANVQANPMLFRVGVASSLVMFMSVFVLIAALYVTVEPVNRSLALLGLVLRLPEATLGVISVVFSLTVAQLAGSDAFVTGLAPQPVQALVPLALSGATASGTVSTLFMALGSLPFLYLFFTARYAPRLLVGFGMLTYVLALVSAFTSILAPGSAVDGMQMVLMVPVMVFELVFGLWLAIRSIPEHVPELPGQSAALAAAHTAP
jgi:hypothetical protein